MATFKFDVIKLFNMMDTESVSLEELKKHVDKAIRYYTEDLYDLEMLENYGAVTYRFTNGELMRFASVSFSPSNNRYEFNDCSNYFTIAINNSVLGTGVSKELRSQSCKNKKAFAFAIANWLEEWLFSVTQALMNNNRRTLLSM